MAAAAAAGSTPLVVASGTASPPFVPLNPLGASPASSYAGGSSPVSAFASASVAASGAPTESKIHKKAAAAADAGGTYSLPPPAGLPGAGAAAAFDPFDISVPPKRPATTRPDVDDPIVTGAIMKYGAKKARWERPASWGSTERYDDGHLTYDRMQQPYVLDAEIRASEERSIAARGLTRAVFGKKMPYPKFSSTDGPGSFDGPGAIHPSRVDNTAIWAAHTKRIKSMECAGRDNPVWKQSKVVTTVRYDGDLFNKRAKASPPDRHVAPLGSFPDFNVKEGELVFTAIGANYRSRASTVHYPDIFGFSCVNGLDRGVATQFLGVAEGEAICNPNGFSTKTFTVLRGGTNTVKHTGWTIIRKFARVAYTTEPFVREVKVSTLSGGEGPPMIQPVILEKGIPPTKFRPAIFEYHNHTVAALFNGIRQIVSGEIAKAVSAPDLDFTSEAGVEATIQKLWKVGVDAAIAQLYHFQYMPSYQPIEVAIDWMALQSAMFCATMRIQLSADFTGSDRGRATAQSLRAYQKLAVQINSKETRAYNLEYAAAVYDLPSVREGASELWRMTTEEAGDDIKKVAMIMALYLPDLIAERINNAIAQQHEWCNSHVIGIALSRAEPGEDIDIWFGEGANL